MALITKLRALLEGKKSYLGIVLAALAFGAGQLGFATPDQVDSGLQLGGLIFGAGIAAKAARIAKALAS
jgi:hypothetical protein